MPYSRRNKRISYILTATLGIELSSALLVPFFDENGLNQTQIMLLQAIFSLAVVVAEIPTGYFADRFSHRSSMRLGAFMAVVSQMGYAFMHGFWQFAIVEIGLACGFSLLSGAQDALVYESILADHDADERADKYRHFSANTDSVKFGFTAVAGALGGIVAGRIGIRPVLFMDGVLALGGFVTTIWLREPPVSRPEPEDGVRKHPLRAMADVIHYCARGHEQLPLLIVLAASLGAVTYIAYWLSATYYMAVGIPLAWFGVIMGVRSTVKAILPQAQKCYGKRWSDRTQLIAFSAVSVATYLLLAYFQQPWAIAFMLCFDAIQALSSPILSERLQRLAPSDIRAQVTSVASMGRRLMFAVLGVLFGFGVDRSIGFGMTLCAVVFAVLCFGSLWRLIRKGGL